MSGLASRAAVVLRQRLSDVESRTAYALALVLAGALAAHAGALRNGFVNIDDRTYIVSNPHVSTGLTLENVVWAFTSVHSSNWHPLTWISHMLDVEIWGLRPLGHHLTSVILHAATAAIVFMVLRRATGALWRSAGVALLLAVHPLHVESVAWASERKDVLSAALFWLTIWSYLAWTLRPTAWRYGAALCCFALALLSKQMVVTLPLVLLLLDVWPLRRGDLSRASAGFGSWSRLLLEKLPFAALSLACAAVTFLAQRGSGAVVQESPLWLNGGNAVLSYARYLGKAFWPFELAVIYPFRAADVTAASVIAALTLLCACSILALVQRRRPWLLFGWGWYVITLLPVAGFVRIGAHAYADRYTYIPLVGIYVIVVWAAAEVSARARLPVIATISFLLLALGALTVQQQRRWESSITLFEHALRVTEDNAVAHKNLGAAYGAIGNTEAGRQHVRAGALLQVREILSLPPRTAPTYFRLGRAYAELDLYEQAVASFREAVRLDGSLPQAHNHLGVALARLGRVDEAAAEFRRALVVDPADSAAQLNLQALQGASPLTPAHTGGDKAAVPPAP